MSQKHKLHMPLPRAFRFLILAAAAGFLSTAVWGQQTKRTTGESDDGRSAPAESELATRNLSRVAASAAQIRAVLASNPGLLVELKRWIAEDAASHGQVVRDVDLMDDSIFDRLETDIRFRSVATSLLQKYGYLVPDINPDSQAGKEQALLIQERTKWMAQAQEEELSSSPNEAECLPDAPERRLLRPAAAGNLPAFANGRPAKPSRSNHAPKCSGAECSVAADGSKWVLQQGNQDDPDRSARFRRDRRFLSTLCNRISGFRSIPQKHERELEQHSERTERIVRRQCRL